MTGRDLSEAYEALTSLTPKGEMYLEIKDQSQMSVTPDEDDTEQDKSLSLVPKELWALYSTDIGRIHSACAIKITEEKEKPLPNT